MGNLNSIVKNLAVNSLANSMVLLDKVQHMFDDFDTDAIGAELLRHRDRMVTRGNEWLGDLGEFFKQVKETVTAFTVTVPFDPETESMEVNVEDGILKITTTFKDDTTERKTFNSVTIPEGCDIERLTKKVNPEKKSALIIIPKVKKDNDNVSDKINAIVEAARAKSKNIKTKSDDTKSGTKVINPKEPKKVVKPKAVKRPKSARKTNKA